MDSNHSPRKLNNKNVDADGDLQRESKKIKLDEEGDCSQVKSEKMLWSEESQVLPSSPPSSKRPTDENRTIHEIAETIPLETRLKVNDIISYKPVLCNAK